MMNVGDDQDIPVCQLRYHKSQLTIVGRKARWIALPKEKLTTLCEMREGLLYHFMSSLWWELANFLSFVLEPAFTKAKIVSIVSQAFHG